MSRNRSETSITCQNPECIYYLTLEGRDIRKNGHNSAGNQTYFCMHCGKYFSETKNTPLYRSHLSYDEITFIFRLLCEKISIKGIIRVLKHHEETIFRYIERFAEHAARINDFILTNIQIGDIELDEIWSFVFKKNKNITDTDDPTYGDFWIYTAIKRDSKLFVGFEGGKRDSDTCNRFVNLLFDRMELPTPDNPIRISTDGHHDYASEISKVYCEPCVKYGQIIKEKSNGLVVDIIKRQVFSDIDLSDITTSVVEGYNNKLRQRLSRLGRKVASFSKTVEGMVMALNIFQFVSNFMDIKDDQTPIMREGLSEKPWTEEDFLNYHFQL